MLDFLRDSIWDGIAGIIAAITLLFYLFDRYSNNFQKHPHPVISFITFVIYGLPISGTIGIMSTSVIAYIFTSLFGNQIRIQGNAGEFFIKLSQFRIWGWGFQTNLPLLHLQLEALGLYFGMLIGLLLMGRYGADVKYDWKVLPDWFHIINVGLVIGFPLIVIINR